MPPALELEPVWDQFIQRNHRRIFVSKIIKQLCKYPLLDQITVLSLENHGFERIFEYLKPCKQLTALYVKKNRISTRDLVQIKHLTSLRCVDLSRNSIHFLPDKEYLSELKNLQILHFRKNQIAGFWQLKNLACLQELRYLSVEGNPCSKIKGCRQLLIEIIPSLHAVDSFIVLDFERKDIASAFPKENVKKKRLLELNRFRPFNKDYNYWRPAKFFAFKPLIKLKLRDRKASNKSKRSNTARARPRTSSVNK